jgi:hypothetical protein
MIGKQTMAKSVKISNDPMTSQNASFVVLADASHITNIAYRTKTMIGKNGERFRNTTLEDNGNFCADRPSHHKDFDGTIDHGVSRIRSQGSKVKQGRKFSET